MSDIAGYNHRTRSKIIDKCPVIRRMTDYGMRTAIPWQDRGHGKKRAAAASRQLSRIFRIGSTERRHQIRKQLVAEADVIR